MDELPKSVCDPHNFSSLFDKYAESIRNFLFYRSGNMQLAEDLTQEAFLTLWKNCKKIIFDSAKSFLYTVAKNKFYNQVAHQQVVIKYQKENPGSSMEFETPEYKMIGEEYLKRLQDAIKQLPDGQREAFLLNRIDKLTYKEIAELLGISETAVEKRIQKALIKMRKTIKDI